MASNTALPRDENPYFAPETSRLAPDLAASTSATGTQRRVHGPGPTTPSGEQPPILSRPRPNTRNNARAVNRQQSSIGLRRIRTRPSQGTLRPAANGGQKANEKRPAQGRQGTDEAADRRRRSTSEPQRPSWLFEQDAGDRDSQHLAPVPEASESATAGRRGSFFAAGRRGSWLRRLPTRQQQQQQQPQETAQQDTEYDSRIVDFLDVVDPEVSTLTSITNLQNSLFIPSLGRFVNRRPTYDISWAQEPTTGGYQDSLQNIPEGSQPQSDGAQRPSAGRAYSITSNVEDTHYAVLPHGASLEGWSKEDVDRLNDHVRHMMHSRRSKFKRSMKGFGRYVSRPLGFLVTLYATLITLFGLAWVLFLIGWIYVGEKQLYVINVIDYILVALFAIVGDGLAPFRVVDTYHMIYIAHYREFSSALQKKKPRKKNQTYLITMLTIVSDRLSWKLRKKLLLPKLRDHNDLPTEAVLPDLEAAHDTASIRSLEPDEEFSVLSPQQQEKLTHHQTKYAKSHTFYRPHETETHFAFPLKLLVVITSLLDLHSCLQISLGACTWGIPYKQRPAALTTVILCCSITVNATAGLLIWIGDRRTRKKDVIERMSRQELTEEAMNKVKKEKEEAEKEEAKKEDHEEGRKSLSLPRLSLDKVAGSFGKKGESSAQRNHDILTEEP